MHPPEKPREPCSCNVKPTSAKDPNTCMHCGGKIE